MYRQGYVKENGQYTRKQYEQCPVCFLHLKLFKCENKLYESYQVVTHIRKCQTLKVKSEVVTDDSDIGSETFLHSKDSSLSSVCSPITSVYIKEEKLSELVKDDNDVGSETFLNSQDSSLSSVYSPMTSVYIKEEELSIKQEMSSSLEFSTGLAFDECDQLSKPLICHPV